MSAHAQVERTHRWNKFASRSAFEQAAEQFILASAEQAIAARGHFRLVLSGGETPRRLYQSLRFAATDWSAWHIYFGDERCLPADDTARNSRMAAIAWLDQVAIPPGQIHPIPAELGPERAAADYAERLAGVEMFDLVLLGLGEDGHTASLFPGGDWERGAGWPDAIAVQDAPKPPRQRVSLSPARLSQSHRCLFLVAGADKRDAICLWRAGAIPPASRIGARDGVDVFFCLEHNGARFADLCR